MEGHNERIEDKGKAEEMAVSSDYSRTRESHLLSKSQDESFGKNKRELYGVQADYWNEKAEHQEERAAIEYDIRQEVEHLSDEELKNLSNGAYEKKAAMNVAGELDHEYEKASLRSFVLENIIQERFKS